MSFLHSGRSLRDEVTSSARSRNVSQARMTNRSVSSLLLLLFATTLYSQQSQTSSDGGQNSNTWDCSDPLLAGSSQCSGQSSGDIGSFSGSGLSGSQTRTQVPGGYVNQAQDQSRSYSDTESQTRQPSNRNLAQSLPLRPEPLTEFQKFAATTSGQILPIFGANLFQNVPSTFAPLDMAPVSPDYVLGPGDELRVRVWGQVNFQVNVRVDRAGEIYIPITQIGPIHVAGLPVSQLDAHLRQAIGRVYRNFDLLADVGQIRAIQIYVAGEARRPGVYTVSSLSTLVDALFASGGPSVQGSLRRIELRRGSETVTTLDLYAFLIHGDKSKDVRLMAGDVLYIPPAGPQAAVTGSVRVPAIYELRANEPLADLIADAGGLSNVASEARVSIERIEDHSERHAMEVAYDTTGLATPVAEGDLVRVFSIVPKYNKTVTLRGNIANPGRFAWKPGMRISDLIPDKESLITRNYWWKRTQLGLPAPEFEPIPGFADLRQPPGNQPYTMKLPPSGTEGMSASELSALGQEQYGLQQSPYGTQQNPYAYQQGQYGAQPGQLGTTSSQYGAILGQSGTSTDQYAAAADQYGAQSQYGAQPGQFGPVLPGQNLSAQQRASNSSLAAEQSNLSTRVSRNAQRTEINLSAPEIDWDYAVIERLNTENLKTTLVPFDLGKLVLQHDESQNIELQPGDIVSILSEADIRIPVAQQTKLVRLEGEFAHAGLYTVKPGETLRQLVERAGGLTPNAYLYGSEFSRESTRVVQQARIDEYVQSLDLQIQRTNLALAASPVSSAQDLASGTSAQSSERELLSRLRQIRATGRIVLELTPASSGTTSFPDIPLEDGDRLVIPPLPVSVSVVGAVNDQSSFLFASDRKVASYLQKAGGLTRDADRKRAFVIRADGEVVGYDAQKGLWGNDFAKLRIYPGDSIVVPEKTFKQSTLRGILDWSQVVSQLGIGAAAINVLR